MEIERQYWDNRSHEHAVEALYSHGAENYGDFHQGYLNFGLWENGISDYVAAAENLVHRVTELDLRPSSRLLDVACGMGAQDVYIYQKFGPIQIEAVDLTWKHLAHAAHRTIEQKCAHAIHFHHSSATKLPFSDASFTHAMSIEGPIHYQTREAFFQEAFRVLKHGGVLALADFAIPRKPQGWEVPFVAATQKLWRIPRENLDHIEIYCTKLARAGFRNIHIEEVSHQTFPGYYAEQRRAKCRSALARIRGFVGGRLGQIIDHMAMAAYLRGLISYILVRAEKPVQDQVQMFPAVSMAPAQAQFAQSGLVER